jgi:hypothetical protein
MKCLLFILAASAALTPQSLRADDPAVPGASFPASRYEALWTKSPFAVATSEASGGESSPDYFLVGIANIDGISYASVIERQHQDHFLISTDKPVRGLTLTSITRGHNISDTYAVVQKNGQSITLKLEQPPPAAATPGAPPNNTAAAGPGAMTPQINMPGIVTSQLPMPGTGLPQPGSIRPPVSRFRRSPIHLPPPPGQQEQPAPAAQPTPPPTTPPPH